MGQFPCIGAVASLSMMNILESLGFIGGVGARF